MIPNLESLPFLSSVPPFALLVALIFLVIWTTAIKAFALWFAARNGQRLWFVALLVVNSLGILELAYLLAFRKDKQSYASPATTVAPETSSA